jgi:uncharacterized protein
MEAVKKFFYLFLGGVLIIWSFYAFLNSPAPAHYQNNSKLFVGSIQIPIEVADSDEERSLGLSRRESLLEGNGLLFIFEIPGSYGFWMKEMRFPIDIVWINEEWEVVGVERKVAPSTFPETFYPPSPVKYVLELNSGEADKKGIDAGSKVTRSQ